MPYADGSPTPAELAAGSAGLGGAAAQLQAQLDARNAQMQKDALEEASRSAMANRVPNNLGGGAGAAAGAISSARDDLRMQLEAAAALEAMRLRATNASEINRFNIALAQLRQDAWNTAANIAVSENQFKAQYGLSTKELLGDLALGLGSLQSTDAANYAAHQLGLANYNLGMRQNEAAMAANPGRWVENAYYLRGQESPQGGPSGLPAFAVDPVYRTPDYSWITKLMEQVASMPGYTPAVLPAQPNLNLQPTTADTSFPMPIIGGSGGGFGGSRLGGGTFGDFGGIGGGVNTSPGGYDTRGSIRGYAEGGEVKDARSFKPGWARARAKVKSGLKAPLPGQTSVVDSPSVAKVPVDSTARPVGEPDTLANPDQLFADEWNRQTLANPMLAPNPGVTAAPIDPRYGTPHAPTMNANTIAAAGQTGIQVNPGVPTGPVVNPMTGLPDAGIQANPVALPTVVNSSAPLAQPAAPVPGSGGGGTGTGTGYYNNMTLEQLLELTRVRNPGQLQAQLQIGPYAPQQGPQTPFAATNPGAQINVPTQNTGGAFTPESVMEEAAGQVGSGGQGGQGGQGGMGGGAMAGLNAQFIQNMLRQVQNSGGITQSPGIMSAVSNLLGAYTNMLPNVRMPGAAEGGQVGGQDIIVGEYGPEKLRVPPGTEVQPIFNPPGRVKPLYNVQPANQDAASLIGQGAMVPELRQVVPSTAAMATPATSITSPASFTPQMPDAGMPSWVLNIIGNVKAQEQQQQQQRQQQQGGRLMPGAADGWDMYGAKDPFADYFKPPTPTAPVYQPPVQQQQPTYTPPTSQQYIEQQNAAEAARQKQWQEMQNIIKSAFPTSGTGASAPRIPAPMPTLPSGGTSTGANSGPGGLGFSGEALLKQPWLQAIISGTPMPMWSGPPGAPLTPNPTPGTDIPLADPRNNPIPDTNPNVATVNPMTAPSTGHGLVSPLLPTGTKIPLPHQVSPVVWARMNPQERQMAESLYQSLSVTPETLRENVRRQLPGMLAPGGSVGGWR